MDWRNECKAGKWQATIRVAAPPTSHTSPQSFSDRLGRYTLLRPPRYSNLVAVADINVFRWILMNGIVEQLS